MAQSLGAAANYPRPAPVRVPNAHRDHPWTGGACHRTGDNPVLNISKRLLTILFAFALLLPFSETGAQTVLWVYEPPASSSQKVAAPDETELEAAEEYQYFVERLEGLAHDYLKSFERFDEYYSIKYQALLQKLILKISEGKFCADPERLREEMEYLREVLHKQQEELVEESNNVKLHRLARKLERELEVMIEELDEEIMTEYAATITREEVREYLRHLRLSSEEEKEIYLETLLEHKELVKRIKEAVEAALLLEKAQLTEEQLKAIEEVAKLQEEIAAWNLEIEIPEPPAPSVPAFVPPVDLPPESPPFITLTPKGRVIVDESGKAVAYREYADSIKVPSANVPIFINSETGDLKVTGWDGDHLVVAFNVEIGAESEGNAEAFAEDIEVKLSGNDKGIYLKSIFPYLRDPKRRIQLSSMYVKVPSRNAVICENSFGTIKVINLTRGLKLNSSYCDVQLDNIKGEIDAVGKMKPLSIINSSGKIRLRNSMGPIFAHQCEGDLDITNSYQAVELTECNGPLVVRNSGPINISDHGGKVTIENSNGPVEITDLNGDLIARNSYKPLSASDIRGSVELSNISSFIEIGDVTGQVTASNTFGSIIGRYLNGPVVFTSEAGTTQLTIHERMKGPSVINSHNGTVELDIAAESNILLSVKAEGGSIVGARGNAIRKDGPFSSTEIKFGQANSPLEVTTVNSTVVIKGAEDI